MYRFTGSCPDVVDLQQGLVIVPVPDIVFIHSGVSPFVIPFQFFFLSLFLRVNSKAIVLKKKNQFCKNRIFLGIDLMLTLTCIVLSKQHKCIP